MLAKLRCQNDCKDKQITSAAEYLVTIMSLTPSFCFDLLEMNVLQMA